MGPIRTHSPTRSMLPILTHGRQPKKFGQFRWLALLQGGEAGKRVGGKGGLNLLPELLSLPLQQPCISKKYFHSCSLGGGKRSGTVRSSHQCIHVPNR